MKQDTVASIVANDMRTATIFKKYGIDFCCGGGRSVSEACKKHNVDGNKVMQEILDLDESEAEHDFLDLPLDQLIDHVIEHHHRYVKEAMPVIMQFANKVAKVHGHHHPETITIAKLFKGVSVELTNHLQKEERVLFPAIKQLLDGVSITQSSALNAPIAAMEHEHDDAGDVFKEIERLSDGFTPPDHACNTYQALYFHLKAFQDDLHIHIHLENNVLFERVKALS
ncbi:MAG: iron-sulfur cluster repair di-iron protein [Flavobacteriales bacterium]|jgi:regulator of cell morphogenesis and NO signaling|nr:iron-sulfur cluster repair di-iron protein [Flavobacteriales bacterium]MBT5023863.1 iron-sulfur cluster repair di-iron protein [Flavobacteriales bacterium]MBT5341662.1 iron-sulfur cluster repair di-iron protein [Flavobacteriales bacterium]